MKWSASRDNVHQKVDQPITTQKFVLIGIWGISGFQVVDRMTEQHSYNTHDFVSHVMGRCGSQYFKTAGTCIFVS
jgi:hypothetical protein